MCDPADDHGHALTKEDVAARIRESFGPKLQGATERLLVEGGHPVRAFGGAHPAGSTLAFEVVRRPDHALVVSTGRSAVGDPEVALRFPLDAAGALPAWSRTLLEHLVALDFATQLEGLSLFPRDAKLVGFGARPDPELGGGEVPVIEMVGLTALELEHDAQDVLAALPPGVLTDPERNSLGDDRLRGMRRAKPPKPWVPDESTRYWSFDQAIALVDRVEQYATLASVGSRVSMPPPGLDFPLGRALEHVSQPIDYAVKGFPKSRSRFFQLTFGRLALDKFLRDGRMRHDLAAAVPGAPAPTAKAKQGAQKVRDAIDRFRAHGGEHAPHFAYGPVPRRDYESVLTMHVADHLGRYLRAPWLCAD